MSTKKALPDFIAPMLSQPGEAFDSKDCFFEIKWDGTRCLAFIDRPSSLPLSPGERGARGEGLRLLNRRRVFLNDRYPDLAFLQGLPAGTVLDGEIVVLRDGKPEFNLLQSREQARTPHRIRSLAHSTPATYVAFDLLYLGHESIMNQPFSERRKLLEVLVKGVNDPQLLLSEGVTGQGKAFFAEACRLNLEGIMAKRSSSRYQPGQRTDAWIKIKKHSELYCSIIGFVPTGKDDFRSLIIAAEHEGKLRCVGKVGTGFTVPLRKKINELLWSRLQPRPVCACDIKGKWVAPGLFCRVVFMEQTKNGDLRAPAFKELIVQ